MTWYHGVQSHAVSTHEGIDVRGSRNAMPEDFRAVIRYLERGTCPTDKLITRVIKPEEGLETLKWWSENPGKVFRILMEM